MASGSKLDEFLADLPTVERAAAIAVLHQAQELVSRDALVPKASAYDPWDAAVKRARETFVPGCTPTITANSPGVVYAWAIRNARKLGFTF